MLRHKCQLKPDALKRLEQHIAQAKDLFTEDQVAQKGSVSKDTLRRILQKDRKNKTVGENILTTFCTNIGFILSPDDYQCADAFPQVEPSLTDRPSAAELSVSGGQGVQIGDHSQQHIYLGPVYQNQLGSPVHGSVDGNENLPPPGRPTFTELCAQFKDVLTPYLKFLIGANSTLDPRGMGKDLRREALALNEIYVSLAVERRARRAWDQDVLESLTEEAVTEAQTEHEEAERRFEELLRRREAKSPKVQRLSLDVAARQHKRIVIVGDPGSGKTTLLRFLARHFAEACRNGQERVVDGEGADYGETLLPIFVRISLYAEAFEKDRNLKLRAYLPKAFGNVQVGEERLRECFDAFLQAGYALTLLDGLDEVSEPGDRAQIAVEIDGFAHGGGDNRLAVTSRIAGYRAAPLGAEFTEYRLLDMNRDQITLFLSRYCPAYERAVHPDETPERIAEEAEKAKRAILEAQEKNPGVQRLTKNPLLLTILALVQRTRAHLPHQRIELYRVASEILLYDWQMARGAAAEKCIEEAEALAMFGPVALWLHTERSSGMAPLRDIQDRFAERLAKERGKQPGDMEIQRDLREFLRRAREHTGLFLERATGYYGFLHLTFQEYFAAREMVARDEDLPEFIYKHRHQPRWEEPILLAISYESRDRPQRASRLIRQAIMPPKTDDMKARFQSDEEEEILHRDLLLAAHCLGDCLRADFDLAQEIAGKIVSLYLDLVQENRFEPLQKLLLERMAYLSGTPGGQIVVEYLVRALDNPNTNVRYGAVQALGQQSVLSAAAIEVLMSLLQDPEWNVRDRAAQALGHQPVLSAETIEALMSLLQDPNANVRSSVAQVLGRQPALSIEAIEVLMHLLQDPDESVRYGAARALLLARQHMVEAIETLVRLLQGPNENMQGTAARTLGRQPALSTEAIEAMVRYLQDPEWNVRSSAARTLGLQSTLSTEAIEALMCLLQDPNERVRDSAARALGRQPTLPVAAIEALMRLLQDPIERVRDSAAQALGRQPALSTEVIEALVSLLQDPYATVRD